MHDFDFDFNISGEEQGSGNPADAVTAPTEPSSVEEPIQEAPQEVAPEGEPTDQLSDEDRQKLEEEAEQALTADDPKDPKWFKNVVKNVYKPKLDKLGEQLKVYEPLSEYGDVEKIGKDLSLLQGLYGFRNNPQTGFPEQTTEPFVKAIHESNPNIAFQLVNDLVALPSPTTQGFSILQEILNTVGIDPTRLDDIKRFAANNYQMQANDSPPPAEELAQIPEPLRDAFASFSPTKREELLFLPSDVRDELLEDKKFRMESEAKQVSDKALSEQTEKARIEKEQQDFRLDVEAKAAEYLQTSGATVFNTFVNNLATQANFSPLDATMIANTVLTALEPTVAGKQSLEALKASGIEIDPALGTLITQLEQTTGHIAYYEKIGDKGQKDALIAKQAELQERITAKGNKVVASLAAKRAESFTAPIVEQNSRLALPQQPIGGVPATLNGASVPSMDFSDSSFLDVLTTSGGIQTR